MTKNTDEMLLPDDRFELLDIDYDQTPWYRRRGFMCITMIFFTPLTLVLLFTGDIYLKHQDKVYKMLPKKKYELTFLCCFFLTMGILMAAK